VDRSSAELSERLAVYPAELLGSTFPIDRLQPVAGGFERVDDALYFAPRFPFVPGTRYALVVREPGSALASSAVYESTFGHHRQSGAPRPFVLEIYPTAAEVPLNLLKVYVCFSAPMSEGMAARHVKVLRAADGVPLDDVFLPAGPELWDPERRRLTLLLDPGRIKRGLVPHEESGYPLREGESIVVEVSALFRDAALAALVTSAARKYEVGPAVRARVDPARWRLHPPGAGSSDPLVVAFDRPLDCALLAHCLGIVDPHGESVPGAVTIGPDERQWTFTPERPWVPGKHALTIESKLEDLAGNSLARVFDRDLHEVIDVPPVGQRATIAFNVAS
jgi:hypothetical protein